MGRIDLRWPHRVREHDAARQRQRADTCILSCVRRPPVHDLCGLAADVLPTVRQVRAGSIRYAAAVAGRNRRWISARRVDTSTTPNIASIMTACAA